MASFMRLSLSRWQRLVCAVFPEDAPGSWNFVSFDFLLASPWTAAALKQAKREALALFETALAPFSTSLMFHRPLSTIQYGHCKAWRFAIIKHKFNDVTLGFKRSAGPTSQTHPCVCFVHTQSINSEAWSPRLDKPIKFMSSIFSRERKELRSLLVRRFSYHHLVLSPQESKLSQVGLNHAAVIVPHHCFSLRSLITGM